MSDVVAITGCSHSHFKHIVVNPTCSQLSGAEKVAAFIFHVIFFPLGIIRLCIIIHAHCFKRGDSSAHDTEIRNQAVASVSSQRQSDSSSAQKSDVRIRRRPKPIIEKKEHRTSIVSKPSASPAAAPKMPNVELTRHQFAQEAAAPSSTASKSSALPNSPFEHWFYKAIDSMVSKAENNACFAKMIAWINEGKELDICNYIAKTIACYEYANEMNDLLEALLKRKPDAQDLNMVIAEAEIGYLSPQSKVEVAQKLISAGASRDTKDATGVTLVDLTRCQAPKPANTPAPVIPTVQLTPTGYQQAPVLQTMALKEAEKLRLKDLCNQAFNTRIAPPDRFQLLPEIVMLIQLGAEMDSAVVKQIVRRSRNIEWFPVFEAFLARREQKFLDEALADLLNGFASSGDVDYIKPIQAVITAGADTAKIPIERMNYFNRTVRDAQSSSSL